MALLQIGEVASDLRLVIFDKDGTLLDFEFMWAELARGAVGQIAGRAGGDAALAGALYDGIGYDWQCGRTRPDGPWAMSGTRQTLTILSSVLYRHGMSWLAAEQTVGAVWQEVCTPSALARLTRPTADLPRLCAGLRRAGVRIAVDTADAEEPTRCSLQALGILDLVNVVVAGNAALPSKPAPERVLHTCGLLAIAPSEAAVVGDTSYDLIMGARAGLALKVGVLSGVSTRAQLEPLADVIVGSVGDIRLA